MKHRLLRGRRWAPALLLVGAVLALGACASDAPQDTLEPEGPVSREINNLVSPVFMIAAVVFVLVEVGVLFLVWRFRRRNGDDDADLPAQTHGNIPLELGWTILPALILTVVAVLTVQTIFEIDDRRDEADLTVEVVGKQWWWEFRYDTDNDGEPDIITANDLVIPAGQPVELSITSEDVTHSFWIPRLGGKMDAVPNRHSPLVLESDAPGTFIGECGEYCGLSHGYMNQRLVALSQADYDAWVENQLQPAEMPAEGTPEYDGAQTFLTVCSGCHLARGINDDEFQEGFVEPDERGESDLLAGPAPDLTHFATRGAFAGALFDLWQPSGDEVTPAWSDIGGTLNEEDLAAWLRDPTGQKPMRPDNRQGMPGYDLTEEQIDDLIAFLETLD